MPLWIFFLGLIIGVVASLIGLFVRNNIPKKPIQTNTTIEADLEISEPDTQPVIEKSDGLTSELEKAKSQINNLYIVNDLGQKVTSSLNLSESFRHLYHTINSMMDASVLELRVIDKKSGKVKLFTNIKSASDETEQADYGNNLSYWCLKNGKDVFLADAENDFARYVLQPLILPDGITAGSALVYPVFLGSEISGTLSVISRTRNAFTEYHHGIVQLLLGYISVALQNALTHEELNLTKIRAEQSEKVKELFLANMSHEIRTPINAVTGMTRLLLDKQPREDQLRYLHSIQKASESLLVIINDILDMSKIEAGKMEIEETDFSVREVLENIQNIMQFKAEEKGLILEYQIDPDFPPVLVGDPTRLTQILLNLTGNAIKFTEKGKVSLRATAEKSNSDKSVCIAGFSVTDTGIGIPEEQLKRLFQNYSQAAPGTSRKYGGTGLGLSISKKLIELQHGSIQVQSAPEKGSEFSFRIPYNISVSKTVSARESKISADMIEALRGINILSADDNEYNRILLKETLESKIPEVVIDEAFDGLEVLNKLDNGNLYDIILMDLIMPNLDGYETAQKIRNSDSDSVANIPIIAFTASVVKSEIDRSIEVGMNGFVPKPFTESQLITTIYNVIHSEKPADIEEVHESLPIKAAEVQETIDLNHMNERFGPDAERKAKHLRLFIDLIPPRLQSLTDAVQQKNFTGARVIAHSMKPQFNAMGVNKAGEILETIEQNCLSTEEHQHIPSLVEKVAELTRTTIADAKNQLAAFDQP